MNRPHPSVPTNSSDGADGLRELVAIATLPALWRGKDSQEIIDTLAQALFGVLRPTLVYVGAKESSAKQFEFEAVSLDGPRIPKGKVREIGAHISAHLDDKNWGEPQTIPHPLKQESLRLVAVPLGHEATYGVIAVATAEDQFPTHLDRVLLGVAATQAAIALENAQHLRERQRAEDVLAESAAHKNAILGSALDCILGMDHEGRIIDFNPAAERTFGYKREDVIGKTVAETIIPDHLREPHRRGLERFLKTGEGPVLNRRVEMPAMRADRTEFVCELSITATKVDGGKQFFTAYLRDITARKRAEAALRESEERYREIFQTAAVSIWDEDFSEVKTALDRLRASGVTDLRQYLKEHREFSEQAVRLVHIIDVNDATLKMFGAKDKQQLLTSLQQIFIPNTLEIFNEELIALWEGRTRFEGETTVRTLHGEHIEILLAMALPAADTEGVRVLVSLMDITQRKRAEERVRLLADAEVMLVASPDYDTTLNQVARLSVGTMADFCFFDLLEGDDNNPIRRVAWAHKDPAQEVLLNQASGFVPRQDFERHPVAQALQTGKPAFVPHVDAAWVRQVATSAEHREYIERLNPGSLITVPLLARGRILGAMTFCRIHGGRAFNQGDFEMAQELGLRVGLAIDNARLYRAAQVEIAERAQVERQLRDSQERFRLALSAGRMGAWTRDFVPEDRISWSSELEAIFGLNAGEFDGTEETFLSFIHPDDRAGLMDKVRQALETGDTYEAEFRFRPRGSDTYRWMAGRARSYYDPNGKLVRLAGIGIDITERKESEEALARAHDQLEERIYERTQELAKANETLRDEIVERMGVEGALRDSEAQYRLLFDRNPMPAWVFDLDTRAILAANETAVWQYGFTREEFLHMNIHELHPPEEAGRTLEYAERFPPEYAYVGTWRHRKHDETVIDVEMFVYEVLFQGRWARLVLAYDITERKRAEVEVRLLELITRAISEATDVNSALQAVLRHVCETTGWTVGEVWIPAVDRDYLECAPAWFASADGLEEFREQAWDFKVPLGVSIEGRAGAAKQTVWIVDLAKESDFLRAEQARSVGVKSGMAFPVLAGEDVLAVLVFFAREPRSEDEHLVKIVSAIAGQVGLAIQRKRAEELLRESEERFRLLVEGAHDYAIYMLDPAGHVMSWNKGAERIKGYTAQEIIGRHFSCFYSQEDVVRGKPDRALQQAVEEGSFEDEGWRHRKGGSRFWAFSTLSALNDANRGLRGFIKVTRDITERKQAEEKLRESEARLTHTQELSLLMLTHVGLEGRWLKVPKRLCELMGYSEAELLAGTLKGVTHPEDFDASWDQCQRLIRGEADSFDLEERCLRKDGKIIWIYFNCSIVRDAENRPLHFIAFIRDITRRKQAEEQIRRSETQLAEAQRLAHLGSWDWDVSTGAIHWSDELYRIYGLKRHSGAITLERYLERVHPSDRERVMSELDRALTEHEPFVFEERIVRADGTARSLLSRGKVIVNEKGEPIRIIGVSLDITERKEVEQRLREYANRLQSLSQRLIDAQESERRLIARELHDQIGQDLTVLKINLQTIQRLPAAEPLAPSVDESIRVVEGLLQQVRNLSLELRPSMLDDLGLASALRWYLDRQAQRAGFTAHFSADEMDGGTPPAIETVCFRVAQEALTNVMRHAHAGRVSVKLRHRDGALEMRIRDNGAGFDVAAARARAAGGESFGILGMEERAALAGGRIDIQSTPGKGTEVRAQFPLNAFAPEKTH